MADERKQRVAALFSLISDDYDQSGVEFFATFGAALGPHTGPLASQDAIRRSLTHRWRARGAGPDRADASGQGVTTSPRSLRLS